MKRNRRQLKAHIIIAAEMAYVKFFKIGHPRRFQYFIDAFYETVPGAKFDGGIKYQAVPLDQIADLWTFCRQTFESSQITLEYRKTGPDSQARLFN